MTPELAGPPQPQPELEPVVPRAAATVVLLRPARPGPGVEAYLLRRRAGMAFAASMHVFPGGTVDERDAELADGAWAGPAASTWAAQLNADEALARRIVCAAVRETFEESGVLLAGPSPTEVVADTRTQDWEADRLALLDHSLSMAEVLARRRLLLRSDLLQPWAHWITPEVEPRRYDTRFFVAALPSGQRTRDVGGEADRVTWLSPAAALDAHSRGAFGMLPPTAMTLAELRPYAGVAEALAGAAGRNLRPRLPRVVVDGASARITLDETGR